MSATLERITAGLVDVEYTERASVDGMLTLDVALGVVPAAMQALRDRCAFQVCTTVTAIDHFPATPRFEMTWLLQSMDNSDRIRVHTRVAGEDPVVPSVTHIWPGAAYNERECYDLFGIRFDGHADLKRILMPEAYEHHPLRKDFPHQGIEPDKLYKAWDAARREPTGGEA